jgi:hypothetical protein
VLKNQIKHFSWLTGWESKVEATLLEIDLSVLTRWTQLIMVFYYNQQTTQEFMKCYHMLMDKVKWTRNKCSTKQELVDLVILKIQAKEVVVKIRLKWEIQCTMETLWRISGKVMLANKMWTISKHNSIKEDNHSNKWLTRMSLIPVIEMEQAHSVLIQVV